MSKEIELTQGKIAIVDDADYERLNQHKWYAFESDNTWYAVRNSSRKDGKQKQIFMHREILGTPVGMYTDHKDGDGLNNSAENIRTCTNTQNCQNRKKRKGTSQFKGVYWYRISNKWLAQIVVEGRHIHLGLFISEIEAACAYDRAAIKYFGEFAGLNFPEVKTYVA